MSLLYSLRSYLLRFMLVFVVVMGLCTSWTWAADAPPPTSSDNLMSTDFTFKASDFLGGVSTSKINLSEGSASKTTEQNLQSFGGSIAKTLLNILVLATAAMTIVAGILMVTSYGESEKAEKAKSILTTCATALLIALFSNALIRVILLLLASN